MSGNSTMRVKKTKFRPPTPPLDVEAAPIHHPSVSSLAFSSYFFSLSRLEELNRPNFLAKFEFSLAGVDGGSGASRRWRRGVGGDNGGWRDGPAHGMMIRRVLEAPFRNHWR